ncbi:MAG: aldo/keto reductase [Alphaproteobacteria bacterium]|nr:aldo/keto reductase [Alphaproteobacteria bacterium]
MERVTFGTSNLSVSPLGLGCYSMSGAYGPQNDDECIATIHRALDLGINLLDTSSNYGQGHNQTLIGKAIKGKRDQFVIHSKLGSIRPDGVNVVSGTPAHIRASCEGGLKRLGIDCVDVICISRVDPVTPIEESVGAMARMVEEGKTRFIALSKDVTPELLDRALAVHPIVSVQDEYSLFARVPEDRLLPAVRAKGLAFMAFAPLGRGLLGGRLRQAADLPEGDERRNDERFQGDNIRRNAEIVRALGDMAAEKGVTVAALVLAWLMHQGGQVIPIPSAKTRAHLEENAKALSLKLSAEDLARIEDICPRGGIAGSSYYDKPAAAS